MKKNVDMHGVFDHLSKEEVDNIFREEIDKEIIGGLKEAERKHQEQVKDLTKWYDKNYK